MLKKILAVITIIILTSCTHGRANRNAEILATGLLGLGIGGMIAATAGTNVVVGCAIGAGVGAAIGARD